MLGFENIRKTNYSMSFIAFLESVMARRDLSAAEARQAMLAILEGAASTAQIAAFLAALRTKGETVDEVLGFAQAMREVAARVDPGSEYHPLVDTCGTGGDRSGTFNISTAAAFVVAGAGVRVAKHGNRSISSRCGSADVMEELGVRIDLAPERVRDCIKETGIGFLFAPAIHAATRHAQPARVELRTRTVFNLLGPLTNPSGANAQLAGAPNPQAASLIAGVLAALGLSRGFVVHGLDGLDEITLTAPTLVYEITEGRIRQREFTPEDFCVPRCSPKDLAGGDRATNAQIIRQVLGGAKGPHRNIVLVNAAAALLAAGKAEDLHEAMELAAHSIDSGAAAARLEALIRFTNQS